MPLSLLTGLAFHVDFGRHRAALQHGLRVHRLPLPLEPPQKVLDCCPPSGGRRPRGARARALSRPRERDQPAALPLPRSREGNQGLPLANARKGNQLLPLVFLDRRGCCVNAAQVKVYSWGQGRVYVQFN